MVCEDGGPHEKLRVHLGTVAAIVHVIGNKDVAHGAGDCSETTACNSGAGLSSVCATGRSEKGVKLGSQLTSR